MSYTTPSRRAWRNAYRLMRRRHPGLQSNADMTLCALGWGRPLHGSRRMIFAHLDLAAGILRSWRAGGAHPSYSAGSDPRRVAGDHLRLARINRLRGANA